MYHYNIAKCIYMNYFENNKLKEYITKKFNIPTDENNLLIINDEDLYLILGDLEQYEYAYEPKLVLLKFTKFTNVHFSFIEQNYYRINPNNLKILLNQSESFKDQLTALITMKNLLGENYE